MTVTVKDKTPLVVPLAVRRRAGLKSGQKIEFKGTPAQRRIIDAQLAEGLDEVKSGSTFGPFETHREMIEFLHAQVKKAGAKGKRRRTA